MKRFISVFFVFFYGVISYAQKDIHNIYTLEYSQKVVYDLADAKFNGREAGTRWSRMAARYIIKEFKKIGYDVSVQNISDKEFSSYPKKMKNVLATLPGKEKGKYVIVGAHYDHLGHTEAGIHYGADDNATGIATILTLAKMVKASGITPKYTLVFCAWDGEEKGLLGSKYFVKEWYENREPGDSICHYMNFDMMGRTVDDALPTVTFAWNDNFHYLYDMCQEAYKQIPAPFRVLYDRRVGDGKGGSDYAPFSARNIPFIAWMEDELHEDYHKPTDTPDKIHWDKHKKSTLLAYEVLIQLLTD